MVTMRDQIESKLNAQFAPPYIEVLDESHGHNVPAGSQTHFKIVAVSEQFDGLSAVKRHQAVYKLLQEELAGGVHALAMHLYSPAEWQARGQAPDSPPCLGGSKHDSPT